MTIPPSQKLSKQAQATYFGTPWYGLSFAQVFESMPEEIVFQLPTPTLHSIAQLITHATNWRKSVVERIENQTINLSIAHPTNWIANSILIQRGWVDIVAESNEISQQLVLKISNFPDDRLEELFTTNDGNTYSFDQLFRGILQHDVYHLGQVIVTKKLLLSNSK